MDSMAMNLADDNHKQKPDAGVTSEILTEGCASWEGTPLPQLITANPCLKVSRYEFKPGVITDWHTHKEIIAGYMLEGELTLVCKDGEERTFYPGEAIIESSQRVHRGENRGSKSAVFIVFMIG